jgi:hypothetical protein
MINNSNSFKTQRGTILVHMKYTREFLKYRKRKNITAKTQKNWKQTNYSTLLAMYKRIGTSFSSTLTSQSYDIQSSLHSALSKYTTLNTKEPTSTYSKQYSVPTPNCPIQFTNNSITIRGITHATLNWESELHNSVITSQ